MTEPKNTHVTLLLPGLLWPIKQADKYYALENLSIKQLELLLSRARRRQRTKSSLEQVLFDLFEIKYESGEDLPVAPVSHLFDAALTEKYYLRADPVHLRPDRDRLIMMGNSDLDITVDEVHEINICINNIFSDKGWNLSTPALTRWYLQLPERPQIHTHLLPAVIGNDIRSFLPYGKDERLWRSTLNEIQMMLHDCPVNKSRQTGGALPVNSLWFWGGGYLPEAESKQWDHIWSDNVLASGLATLADTAHDAMPKNGYQWMKGLSKPGKYLLLFDQAGAYEQFQHIEAWQQWLNVLDKDWFAPILSALKSGDITSVTLDTLTGAVYDISSRRARRWWARTRRLDSLS